MNNSKSDSSNKPTKPISLSNSNPRTRRGPLANLTTFSKSFDAFPELRKFSTEPADDVIVKKYSLRHHSVTSNDIENPDADIMDDIVSLNNSDELAKLHNDILGENTLRNFVYIILDEQTKYILEKRKSPKELAWIYKSLDIKDKEAFQIGRTSIFRILSNNPDMLDKDNLSEILLEVSTTNAKEATDTINANSNKKSNEEIDPLKCINSLNNELNNIKEIVSQAFSPNLIIQNSSHTRRSSLVKKLLKQYTPGNINFVLKVIGDIKHKQWVANSIFIASSAIIFVIKQYESYLEDERVRLNLVVDRTKSALTKLVSGKLILKVCNNYEHTIYSNSIITIMMQTFKKVDDTHNLNSIDQSKRLEIANETFIALAEFLYETRKINPSFHFDQEYNKQITDEFFQLINSNLSSESVNSSISADILKYKIAYIHDQICKRNNKFEKKQMNSKNVRKNDERISNHIIDINKQLIAGSYLLNKSFSNICEFDVNGELSVTTETKSNEKKSSSSEEDRKYIKNKELTNVMQTLVNSMASKAGIKDNSFELKSFFIFKTLIITTASYVANRLLTKTNLSESTKLFINYYSVKYLNIILKHFINIYEVKSFDKYNKYNVIEKEFNFTIENLFKNNNLYPIVNEDGKIESIIVDTSLRKTQWIIAKGFEMASQSIKSQNDLDNILVLIPAQDTAAITKILFIELNKFAQKPDDELDKITLESLDFDQMSEISDAIAALIVKFIDSNYQMSKTPSEFKDQWSRSLNQYMNSKESKIHISGSRKGSNASSNISRRGSATSNDEDSSSLSSSEDDSLETESKSNDRRRVSFSTKQFSKLTIPSISERKSSEVLMSARSESPRFMEGSVKQELRGQLGSSLRRISISSNDGNSLG